MSLSQSVPEEKQSSAFSRIEERRELGQLVPCVTVWLVSKWDKGADRGLDVRSITLDFGSANRTGSVSLQRTKRGKENQPNVPFAGQVLRFRLKKRSSLTLSHLSTHLAWNS